MSLTLEESHYNLFGKHKFICGPKSKWMKRTIFKPFPKLLLLIEFQEKIYFDVPFFNAFYNLVKILIFDEMFLGHAKLTPLALKVGVKLICWFLPDPFLAFSLLCSRLRGLNPTESIAGLLSLSLPPSFGCCKNSASIHLCQLETEREFWVK